jgi:hypothetical protein
VPEDMVVIAITGSANVPPAELEALLDEYVPEDDCLILISADNKTGLNEVRQWCRDVKQVFNDIIDSTIIMMLDEVDSEEKELWVLGIRGEESKIRAAHNLGIPVSDLTRAMFSVEPAEVALDGSESNADGLAESGLGVFMGEGNPPQQRPPQSYILNEDKEIEKIVTGFIRAHEEKFHGAASPEVTEDKTRYYKNSSGNLRRAGRSKIKEGEEEVWLTEAEAQTAGKNPQTG